LGGAIVMAAALQIQTDSSVQEQWQQQLHALSLQTIEPEQRLHWMSIMRDYLFGHDQEPKGYTVSLDDVVTVDLMMQLAQYLCDWPIVIYLREVLEKSYQPEHLVLNNQFALCLAYYHQGMLHEAVQNIKSCMLRDYRQTHLVRQYWQLRQELSRLPFALDDLTSGDLRLMPLSEHHIDAFSWIYADENIASLCNLPSFTSDSDWLDWLNNNQSEPNKHVFVVIHQHWGLIGSVSLEVHNGVGFFYYWLGADFQGYGFGPLAVDILLDFGAGYLAMDCCYAKVYKYNTPSQKAMIKIGFRALSLSALWPDEQEVFYYLGTQINDIKHYEQLQLLFEVQGSDMKLNPTAVFTAQISSER
jgi:RimJ/RimL family protein N-acetyltransferase